MRIQTKLAIGGGRLSIPPDGRRAPVLMEPYGKVGEIVAAHWEGHSAVIDMEISDERLIIWLADQHFKSEV